MLHFLQLYIRAGLVGLHLQPIVLLKLHKEIYLSRFLNVILISLSPTTRHNGLLSSPKLKFFKSILTVSSPKKVSEYEQEMPQSHTVD